MKRLLILLPLLTSSLLFGQETSHIDVVEGIVRKIDADNNLTKRIRDTTTYAKEDGTDSGDSSYTHKEYYFRGSELVKVKISSVWRDWRSDRVVYFSNGNVLKFSEGEATKSSNLYGKIKYSIYYYGSNPPEEVWLIPKPANVIGLATDIFKIIAGKIYNAAPQN